jgi:hypothetical protein
MCDKVNKPRDKDGINKWVRIDKRVEIKQDG